MQYVPAIQPGSDLRRQLVKRMHYVSFVGMFRSDLFEGLYCGRPCAEEMPHLRTLVFDRQCPAYRILR
ncbi:MAG: DUF6076 domain-containing protein [Blautia massiliensis (ex Durand et al. 2017)]